MTRVLMVVGALALSGAAGFLAVALTHPLVAMTNDHQGRSAFAVPRPGDSRLTGAVRLGNAGLLPYTYEVHAADGLPAGAALSILRVEDGVSLYAGHLGSSPVALGSLGPGQRVTLKLMLAEPSGDISAPTLIWSARAVLPAPDAAAMGWAGCGGLLGLDLLLVTGWLRETARRGRLGVRFP